MKLAFLKCRCDNCFRFFNVPCISDFSYGEFVLTSGDGKAFAYLDAVNSPLYNEFSSLVKSQVSNYPDKHRYRVDSVSDTIQFLLSQVIDHTSTGQQLQLNAGNTCPYCGFQNIGYISDVPIDYKHVPEVKSTQWDKLTLKQKKMCVESMLLARYSVI